MWSPRFDKRRPQRRPQRLLEEPPNVTRKMRGLDSGANARSDDREALGFSTLLAPRSCRQRRSAQDGSATSWSDFGTETSARRAPERLAAKRMTLARSTIRRSVLVLRIQCSSVSFSSVGVQVDSFDLLYHYYAIICKQLLALRFASRCNAAGKVIAIRREISGGRRVVFAHLVSRAPRLFTCIPCT